MCKKHTGLQHMQHLDALLVISLSRSSILRDMCLPKNKTSQEIKWVKMYPVAPTHSPTAQP